MNERVLNECLTQKETNMPMNEKENKGIWLLLSSWGTSSSR